MVMPFADIVRHFSELSEAEANELAQVSIAAAVAFLKGHRVPEAAERGSHDIPAKIEACILDEWRRARRAKRRLY
jgi:hypothetical protein